MAMEKRGVIEEGQTPPEKSGKTGEKTAGRDLTQHTTKRLQDAAAGPKIEKKPGKC